MFKGRYRKRERKSHLFRFNTKYFGLSKNIQLTCLFIDISCSICTSIAWVPSQILSLGRFLCYNQKRTCLSVLLSGLNAGIWFTTNHKRSEPFVHPQHSFPVEAKYLNHIFKVQFYMFFYQIETEIYLCRHLNWFPVIVLMSLLYFVSICHIFPPLLSVS